MTNLSALTCASIKYTEQPQQFNFPSALANCLPLEKTQQAVPACEAEQLINQLDHLFGYRKTLHPQQQQQANQLLDQVDTIMESSAICGPSQQQQQQLDQLFNEIDSLYQARSYESLSSQEQKIVDNLLNQLNTALA